MKRPRVSAIPFDRETLLAKSSLRSEVTAFSIDETIENSRSLHERLCQLRVSLNLNLQSGLDSSPNEVVNLSQFLIKLVLMAANAMPFGGVMTVSTSSVKCSKEILGQGQYVRVLIQIERSAPDGTQPVWALSNDEAQSLRALVRAKIAECQGWFVECQETERRISTEVLLPSVARADTETRAAA